MIVEGNIPETVEVQETPEVINEASSQVNEVTNEVEEQPKKPWEKVKTTPKTIPYDRFSDVIAQKNSMEQALMEEREARLKLEEQLNSKVGKAGSNEELKRPSIDDYDTLDEYEEAKDAYIEAKTAIKLRQELEAINRAKEEANYNQSINAKFNEQAQVAIKHIPDLPKAINYIAQFDKHIHPDLQAEILSHEDAPYLIHDIASNEEFLSTLINQPLKGLMMIARYSKPNFGDVGNGEVEEKPVPKVPTKIKGGTSKIDPYDDNISLSEYRKARKR